MNRVILGCFGAGVTYTIAVYQTVLNHNYIWTLMFLANILWAGLVVWGGSDYENELIDTQIKLERAERNLNKMTKINTRHDD